MNVRLVAIVPTEFINLPAVRRELQIALQKSADEVQDDFHLTISTWNRRVKFDKDVSETEAVIGTDDKIYGYVTEGTRPHIIVPRRKKVLAFQIGYKAKTTPRFIGSGPGGASGPDVFAGRVHHPGTAAREFEQAIGEKQEPDFERRVQEAVDRAIGP